MENKTMVQWVVMVLGFWAASCGAQGQEAPIVSGIYTCVDAQGRRLTSDRPIADCIDREQRVLNPSGTVKARVGPALTAAERAALDAKAKKEAEEAARVADEKRRDRALLTRYPNKTIHDQERSEALTQIAAVVKAASLRMEELARQRAVVDAEMEFYKKNPEKAPAYLRRQLEDNIQSQLVQKRFISDQENEVRRINVRFDDELIRLRQLWATVSK